MAYTDCKLIFNNKVKSVNNDHITGEYISTICDEFNLKKQYGKCIPVYLHSLKIYDSNFIAPLLNNDGFT